MAIKRACPPKGGHARGQENKRAKPLAYSVVLDDKIIKMFQFRKSKCFVDSLNLRARIHCQRISSPNTSFN